MIARSWSARATAEGADAYFRFFEEKLAPALAGIDGHRGALVTGRPDGDGAVAISVTTFWDSMAAVSRFAGTHPTRAVVEPEAEALLTSFDAEVRHATVRVDTRR